MRKIIKDLRQRSLFGYILVFSGIVVLIILVMGVYLYQFYYQIIYEDFVENNESYLSSICNRHESDLENIDDIVLQMGLPSRNAEFRLTETPIKSITLEEQLYSYASVSNFFFQLYYFYHDDSYLYNQVTSVSLDRFLNEGMILEHVSSEELQTFLFNKEKGLHVLQEQTLEGYLTQQFRNIALQAVVFAKSVMPSYSSTMLFVVGDSYYDTLMDSEIEDLRETYIISNDKVIVSRGVLNLNEKLLIEKITKVTGISKEVKLNGDRYLLSVQKGESGLLYCTIQNRKIFQNKIVTGQWGILFLLAICSIPTSLAIVALFRRLSKKIRNINALLNEDEDAYYNLETIESGIRTLVENNREMNLENLLFHRTRFIGNFVRNKYASRETVIREGEKVDLHVDSSYFFVVLMGDRGNSNENKAHEIMLKEIAMSKTEDGFGIHLIQNNQSLFAIFGDDLISIKTMMEKFFVIGKEYCEEFVMSTSGMHENFEEASVAYLEASAAYDNRFLVDNSRIIYFSDVAVKEKMELLPKTYLQRLKNAIRLKDETAAINVIREICDYLRSSQQSLLTFRILYNDIIHMMLAEWNSKQTNFENIYSVFALSQCLTIQDFDDILCDVCHKLMDNKNTGSNEKEDMVSKAVEYIKEEYQNPDLNMSSLSQYLKVSGVTLAVEFKSFMGISPSDYLAIIRLEHAKKLLKETQLRVKEVSASVGYEDDHVFIRRFKKYVGKTPGEYRKEEKNAII